MKVLMLSWEYPPNIVGGLGQHVYDLSRFLARSGIEVHIITPRIEGVPDQEILDRVFIHRAGNPKNRQQNFKAWTFYFNGDAIRQAVALVSQSAPFDIIHAHDWLAAYAGRALAKIYQIPLVSTIHATEYGRNQGLHNRIQHEINEIEKNLAVEAAHIICCSKFMQHEITSHFGIDAARVTVIPNGVDLLHLQELSNVPSMNIPKDIWPVVFLGRLVPEKGVEHLINAFARVWPLYPQLRLYIGGKGSHQSVLEEQARVLGIEDQICFTGFINRKDRNYLYSRAKIAVFPSLYEPFGIVALEAMATRTPVIVSDTGGLAEIVQDHWNGLVVPPGDDEALAKAIREIIDNQSQTEMMGVNALHTAIESYDWNMIAHITADTYTELCKAAQNS